jgi:hypothetical protein
MVPTTATATLSDIDLSSSLALLSPGSEIPSQMFLTSCVHQAVSEADCRAGWAAGKDKMFETK